MSTGACSQLVTSLVVMGHLRGDLVWVLETVKDDVSLTPSPPDMGLGELICILRGVAVRIRWAMLYTL